MSNLLPFPSQAERLRQYSAHQAAAAEMGAMARALWSSALIKGEGSDAEQVVIDYARRAYQHARAAQEIADKVRECEQ
jgi:hypothetical protein